MALRSFVGGWSHMASKMIWKTMYKTLWEKTHSSIWEISHKHYLDVEKRVLCRLILSDFIKMLKILGFLMRYHLQHYLRSWGNANNVQVTSVYVLLIFPFVIRLLEYVKKCEQKINFINLTKGSLLSLFRNCPLFNKIEQTLLYTNTYEGRGCSELLQKFEY